MSSIEDTKEMQKAIEDVSEEYLENLTYKQLHELADCFMLPYKGIDIVIKSINSQVRWLTFILFEDIAVYPGIFQEFKEKLRKTYWTTLLEAGTGIGAITSDAIGQQATQALLNTFHSVGTAKSGGPDGIKENITLSANRKILYSILHMKNSRMTFAEMMAMKRRFIGVSISDLLFLPSQSGESMMVNLNEECMINPFDPSLSDKEKFKIFNSNRSWWYCNNNFKGVLDPTNSVSNTRTFLRLKFDLQKLYDYKITTTNIATFINKYKFSITMPKKAGVKSSAKRIVEDHSVYAVPSPTFIGIVDIFTMNISDVDDHILINLIHSKQFKNLIISGVEGINNFYAVSTGITRLIRDVSKTSRFDENPEDGSSPKKGMWLHLENNRFLGIPYSRILSALDSAGIKYEIPHYNSINSYTDKNTDNPFEYHSHKNIPELRTSMKIRAYLYGTLTSHELPSYKYVQFDNGIQKVVDIVPENDHYKCSVIDRGFDVAFYPYTSYMDYDGLICDKKFSSKADFITFISKLDYRIDYANFKSLFSKSNVSHETFFNTPSTEFKLVAFEYAYNTPAVPATYDVFGQVIKPEVKEVNGVCYLIYYLFQISYIDYQINTNLDYCNSRYVTQSLDSVLDTQFTIPYKIAHNTNVSLPEPLRRYKIGNVKYITKPEKRILIKTRMFLKDTYDFMGIVNRKVIIAYLKNVSDDNTDDEKENLVVELANKLDELLWDVKDIIDLCVINGVSLSDNRYVTKDIIDDLGGNHTNMNNFVFSIVKYLRTVSYDVLLETDKDIIKKWDSCIKKFTSSSKPKPLDRMVAFLNKKLSEDEMNYVYAETSGCNFSESITDPLIEGHRSICNHFIQVYDSLGLEGMKNCQNHDLIGMINSSGYISVEYMNFLTTVTTFNGRNPMTSNGVSGQDTRDWLAMATFDSAAVYVKQAALVGKEQSANSTSTCIVLGKKFRSGTGYINITVDKTKLSVSNRKTGFSEKFIKLSGVSGSTGDLFMDDSDGPIYIPKLDMGKFPSSPWIYDNFIIRDIVFYIQQGIENALKTRLEFFDVIDCSEIDIVDDLLFRPTPNSYERVY